MGGKALSVASVRLPREEYFELVANVLGKLHKAFPDLKIECIPAYANKPNFGDMDILIEGGSNYSPIAAATALDSVEYVRNGDVTSYGVKVSAGIFQIDLIKAREDYFDFALKYFSFNDMGNLLGRIAHKFGLKLGHNGLLYPLRDPVNNDLLLADIVVTQDFGEALGVLGYDRSFYDANFNQSAFHDLEDIFQFVVSSQYVNREIYLLENRNYQARRRDAKRPTYNKFLQWLEQQPTNGIPAYPWPESGSPERIIFREKFINNTLKTTFPLFAKSLEEAISNHERQIKIKQYFNGSFVGSVTGFSGKCLGEFLSFIKKSYVSISLFEEFFLTASQDQAILKIEKLASQFSNYYKSSSE